ncbi:hypothetical protein SAMN05444580_12115 [Rhodococcus tukisamuensis]|uniref:Uncharacterized protein n=1 Tax=Rhodococcus tukisamuensis TaxID=168276 RepID=A0A1G7DW16_9NOCA|nr:hypothetical protein SAMN05444580_12115 [Rhodococcus tukisamuensis]
MPQNRPSIRVPTSSTGQSRTPWVPGPADGPRPNHARRPRQFRPTARASNAIGAGRHTVVHTPDGEAHSSATPPGGRREDPLALRPPDSSPENRPPPTRWRRCHQLRAPRIRDTALAAPRCGRPTQRPRTACGARHSEIDWNPTPGRRPTPGQSADARGGRAEPGIPRSTGTRQTADAGAARRRSPGGRIARQTATPLREPGGTASPHPRAIHPRGIPPRCVVRTGGHRPDRTDGTRVPRETAQP